MKILITGVTGFIGSHLALIMSRSHEVYGVVKYSTSRNNRVLNDFLADVTLLTCDIADTQSVCRILRSVDPDVVVHLAALSPVRDSFEAPFSYVQTNVIGTMGIAHGMLELPDFRRRKLIYASTAEVYGIQRVQPIKEDAAHNPSSPYATTKSMTDSYLRMMTQVYGLNATVLRCANTYGRKLDASFFVEYLITSMLRGDKVYIGAPDSIRDYMYVDDHVSAYVAAMEHREINGEAFNIGTGNAISNRDLADKIAGLIRYPKSKIVLGKYPPNYPMRPIESDQPFINLDRSKASKLLRWKSKVGLDDGLRRCLAFWSKRNA